MIKYTFMDSVKNVNNKKYCHDCKKEVKIKEKEIKNGFLLFYKEGERNFLIFKCKDCFAENKELRNYQTCEVYSRIVGYLRPVQQWNLGKQKEFQKRKEYRLKSKD